MTPQQRGQRFTRFILEAKWEQGPVDYGLMAKLRGRITQRLAGTRGVLLSMSGYSDEALEGIVRGQQPDMLLLDRTHLEAMLSGLRSPADLFTELMNRASYRGEVQVPLTDLVVTKDRPMLPVLRLGGRDDSAPLSPRRRPASTVTWFSTVPSRRRPSRTASPSIRTGGCS